LKAVGLGECGRLLESFLEHLVGADAVKEVELVEDAMQECLGVDGDVCEGGVGEGGRDLVPACGEGYLWAWLKARMPWKT
jgi:hypothetical protein